ncbi:MAG: ferredoxin--NADP reductase [Planctomycetota bacterium]
MPKDPHNATLIERVLIHESLARFRVAYNQHEVPDFEPGQYVTLGLPAPAPVTSGTASRPARPGHRPKLTRRAYSIASPATEKNSIEFYIVRVDDGQLTPSLWDLDVGQTLYMNEKIGGHFTLPADEHGRPTTADQTLVMVGTGTGLAPFRSMYLTYRDAAGENKRWNKFVLLDGCRHARDLGYHDELAALAEQDDDFIYLPTVTREPADSAWPGRRGRVNTLLDPESFHAATGLNFSPDSCHVYLCGNPQMIDQAEADLTQRGFVTRDHKHPDGNLHFERYW